MCKHRGRFALPLLHPLRIFHCIYSYVPAYAMEHCKHSCGDKPYNYEEVIIV